MPIPLLPLSIALATGTSLTFGYLVMSTYEGKVLTKLKDHFKNVYPSFPEQPYNLSDNLALQAIGKMRYYVKNYKTDINDNKKLIKLAVDINRDLKIENTPENRRNMSAFLMTVRDDIKKVDSDLYSYIHGGLTDRDLAVKRSVDLSTQSKNVVTEIAPWFLQPRNILKMVIGGGLAYLSIMYLLPASKRVFKK